MRSAAAAVGFAALVAGCASLGPSDADDGGGGGADAAGCQAVVSFTPLQPVAGPTSTVVARSTVGGASGIITYHWTITRAGEPVTFTPLAGDQRDVEFAVPSAGIYDVSLDVG